MEQLLCFTILFLTTSVSAADTFHEKAIEILEDAFQKAPKKVHMIADTLNGKIEEFCGYDKKYVLFHGETGVGKSTLAYALAYKTKREVLRESATNFITQEGRNNTTANLNNFLFIAREI